MVKVIRWNRNSSNTTIDARVATLNSNREAVSHTIEVETENIFDYIAANEAAVEADILANGSIDDYLTNKLRAREAKQLLADSLLEGKTLEQVENYVENNVTNLATAKVVLKEVAAQVWMLYQVAGLTLEALDD